MVLYQMVGDRFFLAGEKQPQWVTWREEQISF